MRKLERIKETFRCMLYPHVLLRIFLSVFCTVALFYVFQQGHQESILAYCVYALSAYTLAVMAFHLLKWLRTIKSSVVRVPFIHRYINDITYRAKVSLYLSLAINVFYAAIRLLSGLYYASFWYGADALYFAVLSIARFILLRHVRNGERDYKKEFQKYRFCGSMLFVLNIAVTAVVYQIIHRDMRYEYPGLLIYVVATYTFFCITTSIINVIKYRKYNSPVLSAGKAISFSKALVSMFTLQTALLASFGEDQTFERLMNTLTGFFVCLSIFAIALYMVLRANKALKKITENEISI